MSKFKKKRSVDEHWLSVPIKYCSGVRGQHTDPNYENSHKKEINDFNFQECYEKGMFPASEIEKLDAIDWFGNHDEWNKQYDHMMTKYVLEPYYKTHTVRKKHDKDFVIIEFYGKHKALCAWRNTERCNVGMTFICPIVTKNKKRYVKYKNQLIPLSAKTGWVY